MLSLLRDGPERAIAEARGPIKHAHSDLKRDHSFVARAARLIKDVLLDMAWELNRLLPAQPAAQESRDEGGDTQWKANKQFVFNTSAHLRRAELI